MLSGKYDEVYTEVLINHAHLMSVVRDNKLATPYKDNLKSCITRVTGLLKAHTTTPAFDQDQLRMFREQQMNRLLGECVAFLKYYHGYTKELVEHLVNNVLGCAPLEDYIDAILAQGESHLLPAQLIKQHGVGKPAEMRQPITDSREQQKKARAAAEFAEQDALENARMIAEEDEKLRQMLKEHKSQQGSQALNSAAASPASGVGGGGGVGRVVAEVKSTLGAFGGTFATAMQKHQHLPSSSSSSAASSASAPAPSPQPQRKPGGSTAGLLAQVYGPPAASSAPPVSLAPGLAALPVSQSPHHAQGGGGGGGVGVGAGNGWYPGMLLGKAAKGVVKVGKGFGFRKSSEG